MRIHHKTRSFHIEWTPAYDMKILYFMEHWYGMSEDEKPFYIKTKILTNDGWRDKEEGIAYPIDRLPHITGRDLWEQGQMELRLKEWARIIYDHIDSGLE